MLPAALSDTYIVFRVGEEMSNKEETYIRFLDADGNLEAEIPNDAELLTAIVGYDHDPATHNYNREERRKIMKFARKNRKNNEKEGKK